MNFYKEKEEGERHREERDRRTYQKRDRERKTEFTFMIIKNKILYRFRIWSKILT